MNHPKLVIQKSPWAYLLKLDPVIWPSPCIKVRGYRKNSCFLCFFVIQSFLWVARARKKMKKKFRTRSFQRSTFCQVQGRGAKSCPYTEVAFSHFRDFWRTTCFHDQMEIFALILLQRLQKKQGVFTHILHSGDETPPRDLIFFEKKFQHRSRNLCVFRRNR